LHNGKDSELRVSVSNDVIGVFLMHVIAFSKNKIHSTFRPVLFSST